MRQKKGQITVYIIIGLLILLGVAAIFYFRHYKTSLNVGKEVETKTEVPYEFAPLVDYFSECLKDKTISGIREIGLHGGYINPSKWGIEANKLEPTEGSGFFLFSQEEKSIVPYWYYFESDNKCVKNCKMRIAIPNLYKSEGEPSIEGQLEEFIESEISGCIKEMSFFENQGYKISEVGIPKSEVNIYENEMLVKLNYPITIGKSSSKKTISEFMITIPIDFPTIYELAREIVNAEKNYTFLERWTMEEITGFSLGAKADSRIAPTAAFVFDPGVPAQYWNKQKIKKSIENDILPHYTPMLQVFDTANYRDRTGTFYERATLPIESPSGKKYWNYEVNFEYLNFWPIYFDISGRSVKDDIVGPEQLMFNLFSFIGIKRYSLYYDVSYPVKITIKNLDDRLINDFPNGYEFIYGIEVNVRDNNPLNASKDADIRINSEIGSLFCDINQRCNNVSVVVKDAVNNSMIDNAVLMYGPANEKCFVGNIKDGFSQSSLPQCVGCYFILSIDGYFSGYWKYSSKCVKDESCKKENVLCNGESIELKIEPYRNKKIKVMKKPFIKKGGRWEFDNVAKELSSGENVIIYLEKIAENENEEPLYLSTFINESLKQTAFYPGLVPGKYKTRIDVYYDLPDKYGRNKIEFKKVKKCEGGVIGSVVGGCVEIGPYIFDDDILIGSVEYNWTLTKSNLDNNNEIVFYAITTIDPSSFDDLDADDLNRMSEKIKEEQIPLVEPSYN